MAVLGSLVLPPGLLRRFRTAAAGLTENGSWHSWDRGSIRRGILRFLGGRFALILFSGLDRAWILEKKLKSRHGAMIPCAPFFLALALSSGWEALMVGADCPV